MSTDFLTAEELQLIKDDFRDLTTDPQVGRTITYNTFTGKGTFDPSTGKVIPTFTSVSVSTFRFPLDEMEIQNSNGHYQVGDYRYMVRITDIGSPKKDDRITDGSATKYVLESSVDSIGIFYTIVARSLSNV